MSVKRPDFLKVLPDDVERVGANAATVLALVRYVTALDGEHNGRILIDRKMWWHASHAEIGAAVGMSHDKVRRAVLKLESAEALRSRYVYDDDRTKAYHVPDRS